MSEMKPGEYRGSDGALYRYSRFEHSGLSHQRNYGPRDWRPNAVIPTGSESVAIAALYNLLDEEAREREREYVEIESPWLLHPYRMVLPERRLESWDVSKGWQSKDWILVDKVAFAAFDAGCEYMKEKQEEDK